MDFLNKLTNQNAKHDENVAKPTDHIQGAETSQSSGGIFGKINEAIGGGQAKPAQKPAESGGLFGKLNEAMGGGQKSEAKEDYLDKGVDWIQENVLGQGQQTNESAIEQAKDEQISDFIRGQYKTATGKEFFVKDK